MALFRLHDDAARALSSLLDDGDLEALTAVSTVARCSFFQSLRNAKSNPPILVLPPDNEARVRTLLRNIGPLRLARFAWIQVATAWHIDLLVECGLVSLVQSVCVVPVVGTEDVESICAKLPLLTSALRLDLADTALVDVSPLALLPQLRELDLSRTHVVDVSSLSSLMQLQVFIMKEAIATDLRGIESLQELQTLRVSAHENVRHKVQISALRNLSKLNTLDLERCSVESTCGFIRVASTVRNLRFKLLYNTVTYPHETPSTLDEEDELVDELTQLETIDVSFSGMFGFLERAEYLDRMSNLRSIGHAVEQGLRSLVHLPHLQELRLYINDYSPRSPLGVYGPADFDALLGFPHLSSLDIEHPIEPSGAWDQEHRAAFSQRVARNAKLLSDVLVQLPQLRRLRFSGYIESTTLAKLVHLERLELRYCQPEFKSFDWVHSLRQLRSLKINVDSSKCDVSALGSLVMLKELDLCESQRICGHHAGVSFLSKLVLLQRLCFAGHHIHNFSIFRTMRSLEELTIKCWCANVEPQNVEALAELRQLQELNIAETTVIDVSSLTTRRRVNHFNGRQAENVVATGLYDYDFEHQVGGTESSLSFGTFVQQPGNKRAHVQNYGQPEPLSAPSQDDSFLLFFDGGSRGNPGRGGSGAVVVRVDSSSTRAQVIWSAAMARGASTTTNNQAEYHGLLTGLTEAYKRRWTPLAVIGDSQLILRQMESYRPPQNAQLLALYAPARRLADSLQVRSWCHHRREYNTMADAAANSAMNSKASSQVSHPTDRPEHARLASLLANDFTHWQLAHVAT